MPAHTRPMEIRTLAKLLRTRTRYSSNLIELTPTTDPSRIVSDPALKVSSRSLRAHVRLIDDKCPLRAILGRRSWENTTFSGAPRRQQSLGWAATRSCAHGNWRDLAHSRQAVDAAPIAHHNFARPFAEPTKCLSMRSGSYELSRFCRFVSAYVGRSVSGCGHISPQFLFQANSFCAARWTERRRHRLRHSQ